MTVYNHIAMSIQCIVVYCTYNTLDCIDSGQQRWFNSMGKSKFKYFFEKKQLTITKFLDDAIFKVC